MWTPQPVNKQALSVMSGKCLFVDGLHRNFQRKGSCGFLCVQGVPGSICYNNISILKRCSGARIPY